MFLKEVRVLQENEKKVSLEVTGDFYEIDEMRKDLNLSESLGLILDITPEVEVACKPKPSSLTPQSAP